MEKARDTVIVILLSVAAAVIYGILHDMITAHVCVEYFTVFHPRIIASQNPAVLALAWGIAATWWVGVALGMLLSYGAVRGSRPRLPWPKFIRLLAVFLCGLFVVSIVSGCIGYNVHGPISTGDLIKAGLPPARLSRFWYDVWSHDGSYLAGLLGGIVLPFVAHRMRDAAQPAVDN